MADSVFPKACNCPLESPTGWIVNKRRPRKLSDPSSTPFTRREGSEDDLVSAGEVASSTSSSNKLSYCLVTSKQMVGIFISVWARRELVQHIGHLRVSCVGRGIMGCLGNKVSSVMTSWWMLNYVFFFPICKRWIYRRVIGGRRGGQLRASRPPCVNTISTMM